MPSTIWSKTQGIEKNFLFVSKHHASIHITTIFVFPSINPNLINTALIKKLIYGFKSNSESLKKQVFMTGFFTLPIKKENKLLIKLLTSLKTKRLVLKFLTKPSWIWKMSKEDLSFILRKVERCKFIKFSLTQYFLMKVHTKVQLSKM